MKKTFIKVLRRISYGAHETSHDFVARGRPLRGQKRLAPLAKRSTCIKSNCEVTVSVKVTANLFGLEFCKILKSYHKIAHYIYFVLKKKLFENVFSLRSYCKFCVLHD